MANRVPGNIRLRSRLYPISCWPKVLNRDKLYPANTETTMDRAVHPNVTLREFKNQRPTGFRANSNEYALKLTSDKGGIRGGCLESINLVGNTEDTNIQYNGNSKTTISRKLIHIAVHCCFLLLFIPIS